ncbi:WD40 repeat-like protein [Myriangium duriaei CBS 260.36]|uniref:WD40 repeat-like protein n=1 Tax=Myriangium duriaei CBS 260.36 TaxID=1168546 RepID=A0A9P4MC58_9PEZI|nr:WD40 repeat-like protein [Myriangium duriaei CBS 260.36]
MMFEEMEYQTHLAAREATNGNNHFDRIRKEFHSGRMATEQGEEKSLKRKRTQRSRQGPSSTTKRRRGDDQPETDDDTAAEVSAQTVVSLANEVKSEQVNTRNRTPKGKSPKSIATTNGIIPDQQSPAATNTKAVSKHASGAVQAPRLKASKQEEDRNKGWTLSRPAGGRFLPKDPKFSSDGQYLFAAKEHQLQVLSVESSVVHKTIVSSEGSVVRAFAPSRVDPDRVYIGFSSPDRVEVWDLEDTNTPVSTEVVDGDVTQITLGRTSQEDEEALYILTRSNETSFLIRAGQTVSKTRTNILDFCISGDTFIGIGHDKLIAGKVKEGEPHSHFVEWSISSHITCFGVRKHNPGSAKKNHGVIPETRLSIALGTTTGEIFVYENVLIGDKPSGSSLPAPRTLHWHREAVGSVKWSRDGNYLISGGAETTLVIWQLATGKKQFLPHLTAEIEQITVSPSGTSYAIQLADNSVMVISTSELKPTAHFPDLQAQAPANNILTQIEHDDAVPQSFRLVGGFHPLKKDQLNIVVPPSAPRSATHTTVTSRPFLQAFDISNGQHLYRQALTRNKVTDLNSGPDGKRIQEPDVYLMQLSFDGSNMATVESWEPPTTDYKFIADEEQAGQEQTRFNRETYLKFWQWNDGKSCWAMQSRISNPHSCSDGSEPGRILDLVSDRSSSRFFTIGDDATVRSWTPRKSARTEVQDWTSRSHTSLPSTSTQDLTATIAISPDSSLLATTLVSHLSSTSTIHLLTTSPLAPLAVLPPVPGQIHSLTFTPRTLFVLSSEVLTVMDIPTLSPQVTLPLPQPKAHIPLPLRHRSLAVQGQLAALATPFFNAAYPTEAWTQLEIVDPLRAKKQVRYRTSLRGVVLGIEPEWRGRNTWRVVMGDGLVIRLSGPREDGGRSADASVGIRAEDTPAVIGAVVEKQDEGRDVEMEVQEDRVVEGEKRVVRPEQLARLFEGGAGMPVRAMFEGVMDLFVPRPVVAAGGEA